VKRRRVWLLAGVLVLIVAVAAVYCFATPHGLSSYFATGERVPPQGEVKPDPHQSQPLDHTPTQADIDRLESVKGRTASETIRILGHPMWVDRQKDGVETWEYDWSASCTVWFKNGVVKEVNYDGGY
jgi:hypothetical protein